MKETKNVEWKYENIIQAIQMPLLIQKNLAIAWNRSIDNFITGILPSPFSLEVI